MRNFEQLHVVQVCQPVREATDHLKKTKLALTEVSLDAAIASVTSDSESISSLKEQKAAVKMFSLFSKQVSAV